MRAKFVVFPIRGRNWCFSRSIDPSMVAAQSSNTPSTFKELCKKISSSSPEHSKKPSEGSKVELAVDFVANKMNGAWSKLEKAPQWTFKNKIHGLNPRLVRRRLRHIAFRGSVIHKNYLYGSAILLPLTSVFMVLPLPNIPFFWILFRTYSHWRASQVFQPTEELQNLLQHHKDADNCLSECNIQYLPEILFELCRCCEIPRFNLVTGFG